MSQNDRTSVESPADPLALDRPSVDWLDAPGPQVEVARAAAPYKSLQLEVMSGTNRVWACNGRYVACRPAGFNPATTSRHNNFLRSKHYAHVGTFDDVQVFQLSPESPFYRVEGDVRQGTWYELLRAAADCAVKQEWAGYVDLLEEIATRLKSRPTGTEPGEIDPALAKQQFMDTLAFVEQLIYLRGGPEQAVVDAGVANIRQRRGAQRSRVIALPPRSGVMRIQ